ncbi:MAG: GOLPH3/VPS74 family protein [Candidatus Aminicenantales bacterium]
MKLNLAEELLLLALKDEKGTVLPAASSALPFGLAGAVLMELSLRKNIEIQGKRLVATGALGPKDPFLNEYWQTIRDKEKPKTIRYWIEKFGGNAKLRKRYLEQLIQKNVLTRVPKKILLVFPGNRYPTTDPRPEAEERSRLRRTVLENMPADDRTAMLISLVRACDLIKEVFPGPERKEAKKKIKEMVKNEAFGDAVTEEITAVITACIAASTAASIAASS